MMAWGTTQLIVTAGDTEQQKVVDHVHEAGQGHVFKYWDELNESSRASLLNQLQQVDLTLMAALHEKFIKSGHDSQKKGDLKPADFINLPTTKQQQAAYHQAKKVGEEALRAGRVAAFLVAGGQGTRLGFNGPKGKFPVSPVKNKTLFQLHAEKILALSRKYDVAIPWYIMTSETNHEESVEFFESNSYFGLGAGNTMFFRQEMIPALSPHGKLILDARDHIFRNPNGHGGSLSALKNSGALDDMRGRGVDIIFYFQVDNVLVKMCDPVFLGYHIQEDAEMSAKVVVKTEPAEKVGVLGCVDSRLGVIEYSDLSKAQMQARNADGSLKFQAGNIAIHILNVDFVEKESEGGLRLPWHVAHKKIPCLDETGSVVEHDQTNGYKFETFVFDALGDAKRTVILEVDRAEEFSPVKNKEGVDSPETARRDLGNQFRRWLEAAGVAWSVGKDAIEISPLFALDAEDLKEKLPSDFQISTGVYLA